MLKEEGGCLCLVHTNRDIGSCPHDIFRRVEGCCDDAHHGRVAEVGGGIVAADAVENEVLRAGECAGQAAATGHDVADIEEV